VEVATGRQGARVAVAPTRPRAAPSLESIPAGRRATAPGARAAALHGYPELARSLGLDPGPLLGRARLRAADLADPDGWVPATAVAWLLELTAVASGREDVGLLLAQQRRLSTLGRLSVVLREEPDVRSALQLLIRYEHTVNEAVRLELSDGRDAATVQVWLEMGEPVPVRQALELAVAALVGLVRSLRDPSWQPRAVCFEHTAPRVPTEHRALLGPVVRFDQDFSGLVLTPGELDLPNTMAVRGDPQLGTYTRQFLQFLPEPRDPGLLPRVRELVQALLPLGRCTMSRVARSLGTTPRTLHRHLAAAGESFAGVVETTRAGLAERYLAADRHSLTDIAYLLGFSAPSAFSRWFRRRFGCSPTQWRARARVAV
jgi:AraC-like DNA-binding protein